MNSYKTKPPDMKKGRIHREQQENGGHGSALQSLLNLCNMLSICSIKDKEQQETKADFTVNNEQWHDIIHMDRLQINQVTEYGIML
ncbi:hypothetical protein M5X08_15255 [Paenibacillus apiarius]|nr:hypothetical protein [Paenibacillus apiarius]MCY9559091.1 hypothetical protein [Paenibacillus apiarius]MCY9683114.1 hypothetical protein [Paenibacillus apiarius]